MSRAAYEQMKAENKEARAARREERREKLRDHFDKCEEKLADRPVG